MGATRQVFAVAKVRCWYAGETQDGYYQPLEKAELVREGGDVTILCYSRMRYVVMQAVQTLEKQGFDPEVSTTCSHCCCNCWSRTCQADKDIMGASVLLALGLVQLAAQGVLP